MKYRVPTLLLILCHGIILCAQPKLALDETTHNFGPVRRNTPVTAEFKVSNSGTTPLVISKVTTSCGCTVAGWTKSPIEPGKTGTVSATFDAKAVGRFNKSIAVYSNATPNLTYLTLVGEVGNHVRNYDTTHPHQIGKVRIDKTTIEFPDANRGDKPEVIIGVANISDANYTPILMHLPPYLTAKATPKVLTKGESGTIQLTLDTKQLRNLGLTQTSIYLAQFMGDKVGDENEIIVSSVLLPDFSKLNDNRLALAPKIELSQTEVNMGAVGSKEKHSVTLLITNNGQSKLEIRELQVFSPAVGVSLKKRFIEPKASTKLKITLNGKEFFKMRRQLRVLMITNDPVHPKVTIQIKATKKQTS